MTDAFPLSAQGTWAPGGSLARQACRTTLRFLRVEHPERLVTDPASAFPRGAQVAPEDRQRDSASAIPLNTSGIVVQRSLLTKNPDRFVEAAVIFMEFQ